VAAILANPAADADVRHLAAATLAHPASRHWTQPGVPAERGDNPRQNYEES
jgi:hypothetical protein